MKQGFGYVDLETKNGVITVHVGNCGTDISKENASRLAVALLQAAGDPCRLLYDQCEPDLIVREG